ncbi:MAG TPA: glutamyl-tRNA reductase [Acidimicrobiia bacterium]|nr:glutamyl-tRNA reductase [Acidimicrobiia bacterium]
MSVIVVGLNHRTVPVGLLERMAVPDEQVPKALHDLVAREHLLEAVVLSTCNRTEIYARCTRFHPAVGDVRDFLAEHSGAAPEAFDDHLYTYYDDAAVAHLFTVAAGLDSMIVGESEILGQVRDAWQFALSEGTAQQGLSRVFRHAVESGKRVRTETGISRHPVSISSAAVAVAAEHLGSLAGCRALVLGAGKMGEGLAASISERGVGDLCLVNRTESRGRAVAERVGGRAVGLGHLGRELVNADVVLASTAAPGIMLERSAIEAVMLERQGRSLLVVDVALPRDVDPGVGQIDGVELLDLDDLKDFAQRSAERRRAEIGTVRQILTQELDRYRADRAAREVAPLVTALRDAGDEIRRGELERFRARLGGLDDETRATIEALTEGIVNKLLHEPTVRVKNAAGTDGGELLADALAVLFGLSQDADEPSGDARDPDAAS